MLMNKGGGVNVLLQGLTGLSIVIGLHQVVMLVVGMMVGLMVLIEML